VMPFTLVFISFSQKWFDTTHMFRQIGKRDFFCPGEAS
jgi:hypothetical protein